jgi:glycosyltransferase involved in cell wall biosynthesis
MKISLIQPSRNNLKYLKWSYDAIRKNQGEHEVEICVADDASTDDTWDWCKGKMAVDPHFKAIRNDPENGRLGHTILYDRLINEVATNDVAMIYHADMYLCPGALDAIEKYIKPGVIVSLTRIEPPLHPDGPEKILFNGGTEPEEFEEEMLLTSIPRLTDVDKTTEGIFAPWAFYRKDFQEIGGHDPLYAPQSKEDSDIFNRFHLNGVKFIQTWEGFVYHMTCRGSRFNPTITQVGKESDEWLAQNVRSTRNFIRKWGHFVMHDKFMKPIIPPKFNIGLRLFNSNLEVLHHLEPWFDNVYVDAAIIDEYIEKEQKNTTYDLRERVLKDSDLCGNDITIRLDAKKLDQETFGYIQQLSQIIDQHGEVGTFDLGPLRITIDSLEEYQDSLIFI